MKASLLAWFDILEGKTWMKLLGDDKSLQGHRELDM